MSVRLATLLTVAGFALASPSQALADNPPTPIEPAPGAAFTAEPGQITFRASTTADPAPNQMDFYVSKDTQTGADGTLAQAVDIISGQPVNGNPGVYRAQPGSAETWPTTPGTYHWQPVYQDCSQSADCANEGPIRSFTVMAENPPTSLAPVPGASFPALPSQILFKASTSADPDVMQFYVSKGTDTNADGVLADEIDVIDAAPRSGDPGVYQARPAADTSWPKTPGTYYWQPVYHDCDVSPDCFNEGVIRSFEVAPLGENPPVPLAPAEAASFTARADQDEILFRASTTANPTDMVFRVSAGTDTNANGVLSNPLEVIEGPESASDPGIYQGRPAPAAAWPKTPGTYYWQPVYHDCSESLDCFNEGPIRSLTVTPLPPPTAISPDDGASIPFGGQRTFSVQDESYPERETRILIEFATDDEVEPDGTFADANSILRVDPPASGPDTYEYVFRQTQAPGTYYWMVQRRDCLAEEDCWVTDGEIRSFTVAPPPPGSAPNTLLTKHPRHRTHKRSVTFAFRSNLPGATFQCYYRGGWTPCSSPETFRRLKPSRYFFRVRAIANGKVDPTPAEWRFRVLR